MESDRIHARAARSCARRSTTTTRRAPSRAGSTGWRDNGIPGITRRRHARARPPHPRRGRDARRDLPGRRCREAEARERIAAEPSMVGRDLAREVTIAEPPRLRGRRRRPADRRARHRHQALDRPQLHLARRDARALPVHDAAPTSCWRATPTASSSSPAPATPRRSDYIVDNDPHAARRASRCSASASATSCSRARSGWRRSSSRSATAAPTTRSRTCAPAGSRSPRRTTASRSRGEPGERLRVRPRRGRAHAREPLRRHVEGIRLLDVPAGCVQYHPEAGPGPERLARPVRRVPRRELAHA